MLYMANWGSRRLMFRIPDSLIDAKELGTYCISEEIDRRKSQDKNYTDPTLVCHNINEINSITLSF